MRRFGEGTSAGADSRVLFFAAASSGPNETNGVEVTIGGTGGAGAVGESRVFRSLKDVDGLKAPRPSSWERLSSSDWASSSSVNSVCSFFELSGVGARRAGISVWSSTKIC